MLARSYDTEQIRMERSTAPVNSAYPMGSVGYHLYRGERVFLGSVIELPSGHWQAHIPGSKRQVDPFVAMQDVLHYREQLFTNGTLGTSCQYRGQQGPQ